MSRGLCDEMRLPCFFGVTSEGDHLPIHKGISVPVFTRLFVHTYFAPGGVSFTVEGLRSHTARVCS